jgi:hypothetical protein
MKNSTELYQEYEVKMQREGLFKLISENFSVSKAIYPGSYIHISPSFYFQKVVYIDSDRKAKKFFADNTFKNLISQMKKYKEESEVIFYGQSYTKSIPEPEYSFDLLISQYAGFVSQSCGKFVRKNGYILANNSHGDAGVIYFNPDYALVAVINYRNNKFYLSTKNLDLYFKPKKQIDVTQEYLLSLNRGLGYKKTANHYLFQKK